MFKIVAFDLDGTIADTIPMCIKVFHNSVSPYTNHELSREEILHTFGLNEIGMVKAIAGQNWKSAIEDFCYIGDTVQDIRDCRDIGVVCLSAAWQESSANADILEKRKS